MRLMQEASRRINTSPKRKRGSLFKPSLALRASVVSVGLWIALCAATANAQPPATLPVAQGTAGAKPAPGLLPWVTSLAEGRQSAVATRKPILIRAGGPACPWCVKLEQEIAKPEVQQALTKWTLVYINVDDSQQDAQALQISGIPALRLQTPAGLAVVSHDGFMEGDALVSWLAEHLEKATAAPDELLVSTEPPSAVEIVRLARHFSDRDAVSREAAVRRLAAHPELVRNHVVQQFREGNLAVRLTALELLRQWEAPIGEFDPWRPATMTPERLTALDRWLDKPLPSQPKSGEPRPLTAPELAAARQEIERMLKGDSDTAAAIRQRLARHGKGLLPEVYARLKESATDQQRERLVALRYDLVASGSLSLRWPQGIERLSATDAALRHKAVGELQALATADDQPLLLELFSDPDPLIREVALRALQKVGGSGATSALIQLLDDPEPNVRAAVLKQLSENPQPALVEKIGEYIAKEKDPDLVVHAIRVLRESKSSVALKSLIGATTHSSWRVRAEATESIGKVLGNSHGSPSGGDLLDVAAARKAVLARLDDEDGFVVSRAIEGLPSDAMAGAIDPLLKAAARFPELTLPAVSVLVRSSAPKDKVFTHLHEFLRRQEPAVRAAAAAGLVMMEDERAVDDIVLALKDPAPEVRLATANAIYGHLVEKRPRMYQLRQQARQPFESPFPQVQSPSGPSLLGTLGRLIIGGSVAESPPVVTNRKGTEEAEVKEAQPALPAESKPVDAEPSHAPSSELENSQDKAAEASSGKTRAAPAVPTARKEASSAPLLPTGEYQPASTKRYVPPSTVAAAAGTAPATAPQVAPPVDKSQLAAPVKEGQKPAGGAESLWDRWIIKDREAKDRPKWLAKVVPALTEMLKEPDAKHQVAAARVLVALGRLEALSVLLDAVDRDPEAFADGALVLSWLLWSERLAAYRQLEKHLDRQEHAVRILTMAMATTEDERAAPLYWQLLGRPKLSEDDAAYLARALGSAYGEDDSEGQGNQGAKLAAEQAEPFVGSGPELRRLVALVVLSAAAPEKAAAAARRIVDDAQIGANLKRDAFQVLLTKLNADEARKMAIDSLGHADAGRQLIAVRMLALGPEELPNLRGGRFSLQLRFSGSSHISIGSSRGDRERTLGPPKGLTIQQLEPLITHADPKLAAYAGYLLALFGDARGMPRLMEQWRGKPDREDPWTKLVYRGIAVSNDPQYVPLLREIYKQVKDWDVSEFYWTIRAMKQPEIVELRAQIRREVGMDRLR